MAAIVAGIFGHFEFIANCDICVGVHGCFSKAIATKCFVDAWFDKWPSLTNRLAFSNASQLM